MRENTKKQSVYRMLRRGATVHKIEDKLSVSTSAARSLINDVRRSGHNIARTTNARGEAVYKAD